MIEPTLPESLPPERLDGIAARHAAPTGPWWRQTAFQALLLLGTVVTLLLVGGILHVQHDARTAAARNSAAAVANASALAQANQQLRKLGGTPVRTPAVLPTPTVTVTVAGPQGVQGLRGDPGAQGPQGSRGPSGPSGLMGMRGQPGPSGQVGENGGTGEPGPTGPSGAQGPSGAEGPTGPAGPSGAEGSPGPAGPSCPDGYVQATVTPRPLESPGETWVICDSTEGAR